MYLLAIAWITVPLVKQSNWVTGCMLHSTHQSLPYTSHKITQHRGKVKLDNGIVPSVLEASLKR